MRPLLLAILVLPLLTACAGEEARIRSAINDANYCETKDDCVFIGAKCPFDCYIYVNTAEADRIKEMVDGYASTCQYSCVQSFGVECRNKVCKAITEIPE